MAELARGMVFDRPWGRTLGALGLRGLTGQLTLTAADGKNYEIAFSNGAVIGAASPVASDAAVRVALTGGLISTTQVADLARKQAAEPGRDEIDVITDHLRLGFDQAMRLRRRTIAQRAARSFSVDKGDFVVHDAITLPRVAGSELDVRAIIYLGARNNLSEARLAAELGLFGTWFRLKPEAFEDLPQFGFTDQERPIIDHLLNGASLGDLEAIVGIDARQVRATLYALCSANACNVEQTRGQGTTKPPPANLRQTDPNLRRSTGSQPPLTKPEPPPAERPPRPGSSPPAPSGRMHRPSQQPLVAYRPGMARRSGGTQPPPIPPSTTHTPFDPRTARDETRPMGAAGNTMPPANARRAATTPASGTEIPPGLPRAKSEPGVARTSSSAEPGFGRGAGSSAEPGTNPGIGSSVGTGSSPGIGSSVGTGSSPGIPRTLTPPAIPRTQTPAPAVPRTQTPAPAVARTQTPTPAVARTQTPSPAVARTQTPTPAPAVARTQTPTPVPVPRTQTSSSAPRTQVPRTVTPPASTPPPLSRTQTPVPRTLTTPVRTKPPSKLPGMQAPEVLALIGERAKLLEAGADHYGMLGVAPTASGDEIRKTYFNLARQLHPDRLTALGIADELRVAHKVFAQLNMAFSVLSDTKRRADYDALLGRGGEEAQREQDARAEELALKILASEEHYRKGEMALKRDDLGTAIAELAQAIAMNPDEPDFAALHAWAVFCATPDKNQIARQTRAALEKAVARAPKSVTPRFYLGRVHRMLGNDKEALDLFRQVIADKPQHFEAQSEVRAIEARMQAPPKGGGGLFGKKR